MRMLLGCVLGVLAVGMLTSAVAAGEGCCPFEQAAKAKLTASKECDAQGLACCPLGPKACGAEGACEAEVAKYLPSILYRVGSFQTSDGGMAARRAAKKSVPVVYLAGGKTFESKPAAIKGCTEIIEKNLAEMLTVRFAVGDQCLSCPNAAKSVAAQNGKKVEILALGRQYDCPDKAKADIAKAKAAIKQVSMAYRIGEKEVHCPTEAKQIASSSDKKIEFAVGKEKTACEVTAKLLMARAKMQALLSVAQG